MKSTFFFLSMIILLTPPVALANTTRPTLFFTSDEHNFLTSFREQNLALLADNAPTDIGQRAGDLSAVALRGTINTQGPALQLRLSSIYYRSADEWTVWLNGRAYTAHQLPQGAEVQSITPESVTLVWPVNAGTRTNPFTLRAGQAYDLNAQAVVADKSAGSLLMGPLP